MYTLKIVDADKNALITVKTVTVLISPKPPVLHFCHLVSLLVNKIILNV